MWIWLSPVRVRSSTLMQTDASWRKTVLRGIAICQPLRGDVPTNPATCAACRLRQEHCVCARAPHLCISTRLIVIIHSKEWRRTTNTGHFARLAIQSAEVRVHGSPKQRMNISDVEASASTLVLYPGRGATPLSSASIAALARPLTLLVPDGNWNQAQHMMRRLPMLSQARPVCLEGPSRDFQCPRPQSCRRPHVHLRGDRAGPWCFGRAGGARRSAEVLPPDLGSHDRQFTTAPSISRSPST